MAHSDADEILDALSPRSTRSTPQRRAADSDIHERQTEIEEQVHYLRDSIGYAPDDSTGRPGKGIAGTVADMRRAQIASDALWKKVGAFVGVASLSTAVAAIYGVAMLLEYLGSLHP